MQVAVAIIDYPISFEMSNLKYGKIVQAKEPVKKIMENIIDVFNRNMEAVTSVYKNAMTFEVFAKIWQDSLYYTDSLIHQIDIAREDTDSKMVDITLDLMTIDDDYVNTRKYLKRNKRKHLIIGIGLPVAIAIYVFVAVVSHNLSALYPLFLFGSLGIMIIVGVCIYNVVKAHSSSKEIKKHTDNALALKKTGRTK